MNHPANHSVIFTNAVAKENFWGTLEHAAGASKAPHTAMKLLTNDFPILKKMSKICGPSVPFEDQETLHNRSGPMPGNDLNNSYGLCFEHSMCQAILKTPNRR